MSSFLSDERLNLFYEYFGIIPTHHTSFYIVICICMHSVLIVRSFVHHSQWCFSLSIITSWHYIPIITYVSHPAEDIVSEMKLTDTIFGKPLANVSICTYHCLNLWRIYNFPNHWVIIYHYYHYHYHHYHHYHCHYYEIVLIICF